MQSNSRAKGILLVAIGTALWGISGTVAQFLFEQKDFNAEWLVVVRLLSSGILLLLFGLLKEDTSVIGIWKLKTDRLKLLSFGVLGMLGVQYTYFSTIAHSNAATATILQYLSPVVITCYLALQSKKLPSRKELIGILLAMLGTFLIITSGNVHSLAISKAALFWGITSAFASALYTLQPISLLKKFTSIAVIGWGMLIGGILFCLVHAPWDFIGIFDFKALLGTLFVILFGTIAAFCCYIESLNYLVPTEASILGCIEPLSAAFLSVFWLHVHFSIFEFIGTACIIATVTLLALAKDEHA